MLRPDHGQTRRFRGFSIVLQRLLFLTVLLFAQTGPGITAAHAEEDGASEDDPAMQQAADGEVEGPEQPAKDTGEVPVEAAMTAPDMDLKEVGPMIEVVTLTPEEAQRERNDNQQSGTPDTDSAAPAAAESARAERELSESPFLLLNAKVKPGTSTRLAWSPNIQIAGLSQPTPVLVVNGARPGPTLCMTAAIHGDELNGIEIVRRVIYDLDPAELSGRVVGIPIVNVQGFQQGSRYLADRRDLNRYFPGDPDGSLANRIAHSLFQQIIRHCDMLVDLHTGSLKRTNLPQLRANMNVPEVADFSRGFDGMAIVHSTGGPGMLRHAAVEAGIVAVTMEAGESLRIQEEQIEAGVNSMNSLLERQEMLDRFFNWGPPEPVFYESHWIRSDKGGILFSDVKLGDRVADGETLGIVADPITNEQFPIRANSDGRILGMAVDQVVMAGFAAYHVGTASDNPEEVVPEDGTRIDGSGDMAESLPDDQGD